MSDERKDRDEDVHRLRDIVVEEVSLVDRAANKRRFLVVKRSSDMPDDTTAGNELDTEDTATDADLEKAKKKPVDENDEEIDEKAAKAAASEEDEEQDDEDEDDDSQKARHVDEDDEDEKDDKKSARQQKQDGSPKEAVLRSLTEALQRLMSLASSLKEALASGEATEDPPAPEVVREIDAIAGMLAKLAETYASPKRKAAVAKAGARMARSRLDRFQKAIELLSSILKELTNARDPVDAKAFPTPSAGAAQLVKREPSAVPSGVTELTAEIRELTRVVKRQEQELSKMRQTRGVSNALPVDGGRRTEPQDVSWPFDMNRPITRDRVRKEVSFFDD